MAPDFFSASLARFLE